MSNPNRQFIDTTPGTAFPELRQVLPPATWHRGAQRMGERLAPAAPPPLPQPTYRATLAARIERSPFTQGALEVLLREFAPGWYSGTPVERILRAGRSDADVELFVSRLEDPRGNLPARLYGSLFALKLIRPR